MAKHIRLEEFREDGPFLAEEQKDNCIFGYLQRVDIICVQNKYWNGGEVRGPLWWEASSLWCNWWVTLQNCKKRNKNICFIERELLEAGT